MDLQRCVSRASVIAEPESFIGVDPNHPHVRPGFVEAALSDLTPFGVVIGV